MCIMNPIMVTFNNLKIVGKIGKLQAKLSDKIPWNKLYVDLIVFIKIPRKVKKTLIIIAIIVVDSVMGWFKIMQ